MKTKAQQLGITKFPYIEKDKNGNMTYFEYSYGWWYKYEYDESDNRTYLESADGHKEYTII